MVQINFARKEINCKIVYYGPGLSGKTTNLEIVHERAPQDNKGELTSISTDGDRTLFFDFMPLDLGTIAGMRTKFHIYTVPGQVYYNSTRKLVLLGADGVIFVADSSPGAMDANKQSLENLAENLAEMGKDLAKIPHVIQYNKRDMEGAMTVEQLENELNTLKVPSFEAIASKGDGVFQTLKGISSLVLESINSNERKATLGVSESSAAPAAQPAQAAEATPALEASPAAASMTQGEPGTGPAKEAPAPVGASAPSSDMQIERNHVPSPQAPASTQGEPAPLQAAAQRQDAPGDFKPVSSGQEAFEASSASATATLAEPETVEKQPETKTKPKAKAQVQAEAGPAKPSPARKPELQPARNKAPAPTPVREKKAGETKPGVKASQKSAFSVVGGKPGSQKKSSVMGIVVVVAVVVLLAGAGVAYYMMM